MRVTYTGRALRDLTRIYRYIARDSPLAAARMLSALYAGCDGLENFPRRGRLVKKTGSRQLTTVRPYIINYDIEPDGMISINAVWHGAQNRRR
jgi:plasmid stabilization system protein ParE